MSSYSKTHFVAGVTGISVLLMAIGACHAPKEYVSFNLQKQYDTPFEVWQRVSVIGIGGRTRVEGDDYGHLRITYQGRVIKELQGTSFDILSNFIGGRRYLYALRSIDHERPASRRELVVRFDKSGHEVVCADVTSFQDPYFRLRLTGIEGHSAILERVEGNKYQEVEAPLSWCSEAAEVVKKKAEGTLPAPPQHGLPSEPD